MRGWAEERVSGPVFSFSGRFGGVLMDLALGFALDGEVGDQLRTFVCWRESPGAHVDGLFLGIWSAVTGEPYEPKTSDKKAAALRRRLKRHVVAILHVLPDESMLSHDVAQGNLEIRVAIAQQLSYRLGLWLKLVPEHAARLRAIVGDAT